jgi:hypothetical protein
LRVYSLIEEIIHGPKKARLANMAAIFGTKVRVCSWILVVA